MDTPELIARLAHQYSTSKNNIRQCIKETEKRFANSLSQQEVFGLLQGLIPSASDGTYPPLPVSPVKKVKRKNITSTKNIPSTYTETGECFSCYNPIFETHDFPPYVCVAAKNVHEARDPLTLPPSEREIRYVIKCPSCESTVCIHDLEGYYTSNKLKPCCINGNCNTEFDLSILKRYVPSSYFPLFRKILKAAIYEEQLSQLPLTEASIAVSGYSTLGETRITIAGDLGPRSKKTENRIKVKKLPVKCLIDGCSGVLNDSTYKCEKCGKKKCRKCKAYKADKNHVCDPYTLTLIEQERNNGCTCPQCGEIWQKTVGCDHMWCVSCHAHYNYVKGGVGKLIPKGEQTNPAWREYQRTKMAIKASKEGNVVRNVLIDVGECPGERQYPEIFFILRQLYVLFNGHDDEVVRLIEGVHRVATNDLYGFPLRTYTEILQEESMSVEREFLILARDQIKINIDATMPQTHNLQGNLLPLRKNETFVNYIGNEIPKQILNLTTRTYDMDKCHKLFKERAFRYYKRNLYARKYLDIANMFVASSAIIFRNIEHSLLPVQHQMDFYDLYNMRKTNYKNDVLYYTKVGKDEFVNDGNYLVPLIDQIDDKENIKKIVIQELLSFVDLIKQTNVFFKEIAEAYGEPKYPFINHNLEFYSPSNACLVNNTDHVGRNRHTVSMEGKRITKILDIEKWELPTYITDRQEDNFNILYAIATKKYQTIELLIDNEGGEWYNLRGSTITIHVVNDMPYFKKVVDAIESVKQNLKGSFTVRSNRAYNNTDNQEKIDLIARIIDFSSFRTVRVDLYDITGNETYDMHSVDLTKFTKAIIRHKFKTITVRLPSLTNEQYMKFITKIRKGKPLLGSGSYVEIIVVFNRLFNFDNMINRGHIKKRVVEALGNYREEGLAVAFSNGVGGFTDVHSVFTLKIKNTRD